MQDVLLEQQDADLAGEGTSGGGVKFHYCTREIVRAHFNLP